MQILSRYDIAAGLCYVGALPAIMNHLSAH